MGTTSTQVRVLLTSGKSVELSGDDARELWLELGKLYVGSGSGKEYVPYPVPTCPGVVPVPYPYPYTPSYPIITCTTADTKAK